VVVLPTTAGGYAYKTALPFYLAALPPTRIVGRLMLYKADLRESGKSCIFENTFHFITT
jgi:hypothetical protein